MNKDVIIICESIYHGNTMKLARAFSSRLQCRLITADEALLVDLKAYQTVGLASGIYFTSHHPQNYGDHRSTKCQPQNLHRLNSWSSLFG